MELMNQCLQKRENINDAKGLQNRPQKCKEF